jgi:hypothetical protein
MVFTAPVYPMAWDRERVMQDDGCLRLSTWSVTQMLTKEGLAEKYRSQGYFFLLNVQFSVSRRS